MQDRTDQQLLREYADRRSEEAFTELAQRYVDVVYSAALRMVRNSHLAEDVTQGAFMALAQNARQLMARGVLAGWLHRTTQNLAANAIRTDVRRRAREQEAATMSELLATEGNSLWEQVAPHLDGALGELSDADRDAVLLRYFRHQSTREIAHSLGTSEDAAQKRVNRAVERLRGFLVKRGVTVSGSGLVVLVSASAVQSAPAGLAISVSAVAAAAGATAATTAIATATKTLVMTTLQKTLITAAIATAIGSGLYEGRKAVRLHREVELLQQQQTPLAEQIEQLKQGKEAVARELAAAQQELEQLRQETAELPRLRGEVARLQGLSAPVRGNSGAGDINDSFAQFLQASTVRAKKLKEHLDRMPDKQIPELQFLSANDWLNAVKDAKLDSDENIRKTLSKLRSIAKNNLPIGRYLHAFARDHGGRLPDELGELKPYLRQPVTDSSYYSWPGIEPGGDDSVLDAILARYQLVHTGNVSDVGPNEWLVVEKAPVDKEYDTLLKFRSGYSESFDLATRPAGDADFKPFK